MDWSPMEPNESVQLFYERILKYTKGLNVTDEHKLALFIANLPKHITDFLILQNVADLPTALRMAKQKELIGSEDEKETEKLLASILEKLDKNEKQCNAIETEQFSQKEPPPCAFCSLSGHKMECNMMDSPPHCMFCGKEGHAMKDCPFYKKQNDNVRGATPITQKNKGNNNYHYQRNGPRPGTGGGHVVCYFCSKPGHVMKHCKDLPANRSGNQNNAQRRIKCSYCHRDGHIRADCYYY